MKLCRHLQAWLDGEAGAVFRMLCAKEHAGIGSHAKAIVPSALNTPKMPAALVSPASSKAIPHLSNIACSMLLPLIIHVTSFCSYTADS